jgi:hypothetical protein
MKQILLALSGLLVLGSSAFAADISGKYYTPIYQAPGADGFTPESLQIINSDGTYEVRTIHFDSQEIYRGTYSVNGNRATFHKGTYVATCPDVINDDDGDFVVDFSRTDSSLTITANGQSQTLQVATPEQIKKVLSYPVCGQ